jgi:hypothetical protein
MLLSPQEGIGPPQLVKLQALLAQRHRHAALPWQLSVSDVLPLFSSQRDAVLQVTMHFWACSQWKVQW